MNADNMIERTKSAEEVRGIACERDLDWVYFSGLGIRSRVTRLSCHMRASRPRPPATREYERYSLDLRKSGLRPRRQLPTVEGS
jgi:hypothetical protein